MRGGRGLCSSGMAEGDAAKARQPNPRTEQEGDNGVITYSHSVHVDLISYYLAAGRAQAAAQSSDSELLVADETRSGELAS